MSDILGILKKLSSDPGLLDQLKSTKTPEDIVALAKANGVDVSLDDVKKALSEKEKYKGLLDHLMK